MIDVLLMKGGVSYLDCLIGKSVNIGLYFSISQHANVQTRTR